MHNARTFILKLSIVAASLVLADIAIGKLLAHYYFRIAHGEQGRMTYSADSVTAPILVLGSSRAAHGYIPGIIEDSLHLQCYNTGKDNQGIFYSLAILKMALRRYTPRLLILDLTPGSFLSAESGLDELAVLLPYYRPHPEIRPTLDKRSPWEWLKTRSRLYCYNSLILPVIKKTISDNDEDSAVSGYIPKYMTLAGDPYPAFTPQQLSAPPDTACVAAFEQIITLAARHNCQLVVVASPVYYPGCGNSSTLTLAHELCTKRQIPFLDYTHSEAFTTEKLAIFDDALHVNDAGAHRFTRLLCTDLLATLHLSPK